MPARITGRLLTGPAAFLLGGALEMLRFAVSTFRERGRARRRRSTVRSHVT